MTGLVETIWLFVRGNDSVRVIRAATPEGRARLLIFGPGNTQTTQEFENVVSCTTYEAALEKELVVDGFTLEQFTDRRGGSERRNTSRDEPDRRRE